MQESADNVSPESSSPSKDALLEEACKKYEEATRLCPTLNDVRVTDTMFYSMVKNINEKSTSLMLLMLKNYNVVFTG